MSMIGKIAALGIGAVIGAIAMDVYRDGTGKENQDILDIGAVDDNDTAPDVISDEDMDIEEENQ